MLNDMQEKLLNSMVRHINTYSVLTLHLHTKISATGRPHFKISFIHVTHVFLLKWYGNRNEETSLTHSSIKRRSILAWIASGAEYNIHLLTKISFISLMHLI